LAKTHDSKQDQQEQNDDEGELNDAGSVFFPSPPA
jgi:hypothetical protein